MKSIRVFEVMIDQKRLKGFRKSGRIGQGRRVTDKEG